MKKFNLKNTNNDSQIGLYEKIFFDNDIQIFMEKNNLTKNNLRGSYGDLKEFINNKDKYELNWNGAVELELKMRKNNAGIIYIGASIFSYDININNINNVTDNKKNILLECKDNINTGYYLYGENGIGKTFLTVAIANMRYDSIKKKTLFVHWPEFILTMKNFNTSSNNILEKVKRTKYLIIDDLGQEKISAWSRDDILNPIITFRMENKLPTFITSNYSIEELKVLYTEKKIESKKVNSLFTKLQTMSKEIRYSNKNF